MSTIIILIPLNNDDRVNGRGVAESIEHNTTLETIQKEHGEDIEGYSLSDFMDLCNNQEFNPDSYWVSYINC